MLRWEKPARLFSEKDGSFNFFDSLRPEKARWAFSGLSV